VRFHFALADAQHSVYWSALRVAVSRHYTSGTVAPPLACDKHKCVCDGELYMARANSLFEMSMTFTGAQVRRIRGHSRRVIREHSPPLMRHSNHWQAPRLYYGVPVITARAKFANAIRYRRAAFLERPCPTPVRHSGVFPHTHTPTAVFGSVSSQGQTQFGNATGHCQLVIL